MLASTLDMLDTELQKEKKEPEPAAGLGRSHPHRGLPRPARDSARRGGRCHCNSHSHSLTAHSTQQRKRSGLLIHCSLILIPTEQQREVKWQAVGVRRCALCVQIVLAAARADVVSSVGATATVGQQAR